MNRRMKDISTVIVSTILGAAAVVTFEEYSANRNGEVVETRPVAATEVVEKAVTAVEPQPSVPSLGVPAEHSTAPQGVPRTGATSAQRVAPQSLMLTPPPTGERVWAHTPHTYLGCANVELQEWAKVFEVWEIWCIGDNGQEQRIAGNWPKPINWPWPEPQMAAMKAASNKYAPEGAEGKVSDGLGSGINSRFSVQSSTGASEPRRRVGTVDRGSAAAPAAGSTKPERLRPRAIGITGGREDRTVATSTVVPLRCSPLPLQELGATCGWYRQGGIFWFYNGKRLTDLKMLPCSDARIRKYAGLEYNFWVSGDGRWINRGQRKGTPNLFCEESLQFQAEDGGWFVVPQIIRMNANDDELDALAIYARHQYISRPAASEEGK